MVSGSTTAHGESYAADVPKAAPWKLRSEMMPVHLFTSKCHSWPPRCQDAWGCWEPAAPAKAQSQELWDSDSVGDRAACHGASAHCLLACSTCCTWLVLVRKQKPSEQPPLCCTLEGSFPVLWMLSTSEKQMHSWESIHTGIHLFPQPGPMDVSSLIYVTLCSVLLGKSFRARIEVYS